MAPVALQVLLAWLAASHLVFFFRALHPAAALLSSGLLLASLAYLFRRREPARGVDWRWTAACFALAVLVSVLGGAGHLLHTTDDWQVRDAVLADVARGPWPVVYGGASAGLVLRAPVGFFVIPALFGRAFGLEAAHWAVLIQDSVLLSAILLLLVRGVQTPWRRAVVLGVFLLFSGWDILGELKVRAMVHATTPFPLHIERWSGDLEYSSFVTDIFWSPNHGLPAFAFVGAYLAWRRGECTAPALAAFSALCLLWSPLAVMGMTPFVALALLSELSRRELSWPALGAACTLGLSLLPVVIYLTLAGGSVAHHFAFTAPGFWPRYGLFATLEILPILYLALRSGVGETEAGKVELALIAVMLLTIPLYLIGVCNDFMMRASIVPLCLAAVVVAERLNASIAARAWAPVAASAVVLGIGAATPALEVTQALVGPPSPPVSLDVPHAWAQSVFSEDPIATYVAPAGALDRWRAVFRSAPVAPPPARVAQAQAD